MNFNPRPPRGGRLPIIGIAIGQDVFQSTPPARGATIRSRRRCAGAYNFNPRPPRGGRLLRWSSRPCPLVISIHAPREGGDCEDMREQLVACPHFNPRPPRGGRRSGTGWGGTVRIISIHAPREGGDFRAGQEAPARAISIHAPREGGDGWRSCPGGRPVDFNPRPPRGGRHA